MHSNSVIKTSLGKLPNGNYEYVTTIPLDTPLNRARLGATMLARISRNVVTSGKEHWILSLVCVV
jgi:hypothetical protein